MAIGVLVLGESGTGKTYSIHNFKPDEVDILSVQKSILPFRGKYNIKKTPTAEDVINALRSSKKKYIVIDDFQYILGIPMMKRIGEKGWEKFSEIQQGYSDVLDVINEPPDDMIIFLTSHVMYNDDTGRVQIKTIGKALDKYITIEGLFMIVLGTQVIDGKYYFITQNNGSNTLKSPEGMFPSIAIPNDLKYVADKILNYYYMDGAKTDEEIKKEDAEAAIPDEEVKPVRRGRRKSVAIKVEAEDRKSEIQTPEPEAVPWPADEVPGIDEEPKRKDRSVSVEKSEIQESEDQTFETQESETEKPRRRRRRA